MANFDGSPTVTFAEAGASGADIVKEARDRFRLCVEADDRTEALDDLRFLLGGDNQWDAAAVRQRQLDNKPCLTDNDIPAILHQVTNDARQNKQSIHVAPVDSGADVKVAEVLAGLIRHIEYDSDADAAYDTALEGAARIGFGYFRLITEYESETSFNQVIKIKRIRNPFTVYTDPDAQEADGSDMRFAMISTKVPRKEFERAYPGRSAAGDGIGTSTGDDATWVGEDYVRLAEYYRVEMEPATLCMLSDGSTVYKGDKDYNAALNIVAERPSARKKVMWYKISGWEVLEKAEIACPWIPIFPVYGDEIDIDGTVTRNGLIRNAKDPKKRANFWMPLSLDTVVPTPEGWTTIGEIGEGDTVFNEEGKPCEVVGKSPVYINRKCFKIVFDDDSEIISDGEHPWIVSEKSDPKHGKWIERKISTAEMVPGQHKIRCAGPIEMPSANLPIDPYYLGFWLGDGHSSASTVTVDHNDLDEVRGALEDRGLSIGGVHNVSREGDAATFSVKGLMPAFRSLDLVDNKHVPEIYLRASVEQRLELLRGLMDTDGSITTKWQNCMFHNTKPEIIEAVVELLRSLGIRSRTIWRAARVSKMANGHEIIGRQPLGMVYFSAPKHDVFCLSRKRNVQQAKAHKPRYEKRTGYWGIKSVTEVPSVPVQCIAVDTPSHLFLAGPSMIPTHNTSATEEIALRTKTPWIGALGQFEGMENDWDQANIRNFSYLEYNPISVDGTLAPAPQRQVPADVPAGYIQMMIMSRDAVKAVTGIYDASLGNRSNETSGIAINQRKQQGELGNFHFTDNLTRAITRMAKCLIAMIPRIYDTQRVLRILGEDRKTATYETVNQRVQQFDERGQAIETVLNDLTVGTYDVTVSTGPAYQTLRQETVANMVEVGKNWPVLMELAGDEVIKNMDWPGAQETAERVKKWIMQKNPGLIEGDDEQPNMVQTPRGPIPADQAGQLIAQMNDALERMQAEIDDYESGIAKTREDNASKERIAEMNNQTKLDVEELKGMIALLVDQVNPILAHQAAVLAAADPEHPNAPAPIAQGLEQAPAVMQQQEAQEGEEMPNG